MKKTILRAALYFPVLALAFSFTANAQAVTLEDLKAQMVKDWERAKTYTIDYLNVMPADKYSFKATDSVRSFAQQMLHLAGANVMLMSNTTDLKTPFMRMDLESSAGAQSKDSVMHFVTASYDFCINAVKTSDISKWGEKKKIFGRFDETKLAMLMKTFEHQTHHRGQTTIYIRLVGVKPPNERLF
ncbi:MAG: DinB family protein [Chitinophagaceae bacterium]